MTRPDTREDILSLALKPNVVEVVNAGRWELRLIYGPGDAARDAMHVMADRLRAAPTPPAAAAWLDSLALETAREVVRENGYHHNGGDGHKLAAIQCIIGRSLAKAAPPAAEAPANAYGWTYLNDGKVEWSEQHPVESGEVLDATDIRAATAEVLHGLLVEAWTDRVDKARAWDMLVAKAPPAAEAPGQGPYKLQFPGTVLRKLWTGRDFQDWLDKLPSLYATPPTYADAEAKEFEPAADEIERMAEAIYAVHENSAAHTYGYLRPALAKPYWDAALIAIRSLASPAPKGET